MPDPAPFAAKTGDKTGLFLRGALGHGHPKVFQAHIGYPGTGGRVFDLECRTAGHRPFLILEQLQEYPSAPRMLLFASLVRARDREVNRQRPEETKYLHWKTSLDLSLKPLCPVCLLSATWLRYKLLPALLSSVRRLARRSKRGISAGPEHLSAWRQDCLQEPLSWHPCCPPPRETWEQWPLGKNDSGGR